MSFVGSTLLGGIELSGATVRGPVEVRDCTLNEVFSARYTFFDGGPPSFIGTTFKKDVDISFAHTERVSVAFQNCTFETGLVAQGISGDMLVHDSECRGDLSLANGNAGGLSLRNTAVKGSLDCTGTKCGSFHGQGLRLERTYRFGPLTARNGCYLPGALFAARVTIDVEAETVDLTNVQFVQGGSLVCAAQLLGLQQVSSGGPLRISAKPGSSALPTILSLNGVDAGRLTLALVDLSRCVFYGAHDLGRIAVEATVGFASVPDWWRTHRRCTADEFLARKEDRLPLSGNWTLPLSQPLEKRRSRGDPLASPHTLPLSAREVAAVYRDLRRSLEARADQPGAADFYYGEMEMRRLSRETAGGERLLLWLYWATSGYGLRASRALIWLAVVVAAGAILAHRLAFQAPSTGWSTAVLFALRSVLPGVRKPQMLTEAGEAIEIALALLGPLLFGLFLLALRGRVRR